MLQYFLVMPRTGRDTRHKERGNSVERIVKALRLPSQPSVFGFRGNYESPEEPSYPIDKFSRQICGFGEKALKVLRTQGYFTEEQDTIPILFNGKTFLPKVSLPAKHLEIKNDGREAFLVIGFGEEAQSEIGHSTKNSNLERVNEPPIYRSLGRTSLVAYLGQIPDRYQGVDIKSHLHGLASIIGVAGISLSGVTEINNKPIDPNMRLADITRLWK